MRLLEIFRSEDGRRREGEAGGEHRQQQRREPSGIVLHQMPQRVEGSGRRGPRRDLAAAHFEPPCLRQPATVIGEDHQRTAADDVKRPPAERQKIDQRENERGEADAGGVHRAQRAGRPAAHARIDFFGDDDETERLFAIAENARQHLRGDELLGRLREGRRDGEKRFDEDGDQQQPAPSEDIGQRCDQKRSERGQAEEADRQADGVFRDVQAALDLRQG